MEETKFLKSINDLKEKTFVVESYQRGYRWEEKQVTDLLNDLYEFDTKHKTEDNIYCLQPIVVKKIQENEYEIIDGQQRLTTIYILLKFLNKKMYDIDYKTRKDSREFLENIDKDVENSTKNIDFHFMKNAFDVIKKWFEQKSEEEKDYALDDDFRRLLIGREKRVKFIWYEIEDGKSTSEEVFSRINVGKIPLDDAELIKAKLLFNANTDNKKEKYERQLEIGSEWDNIEQGLRNERFWSFLVNEKIQKTNKIEYIFDYIAKNTKNKEYYTFETIQNMLENNSTNYEFWNQKVKKYYSMLKEWYNDIELYNYIGLLNIYGSATYSLMDEYEHNYQEKDKFKEHVKEEVIKWAKKEIVEEIDEVKDLTYKNNYKQLKKLLFLLNVLTDIKLNQRFPFEKCPIKEWSIEHIHPQNAENLGDNKEKWKTWSEDEIKTVNELIEKFKKEGESNKVRTYEEVLSELMNINENVESLKTNQLQNIYSDVSNKISPEYGKKEMQTLGNLALLDKTLNSMINNNFFDTKRTNIINAEKEGVYIPPCTKNVFMKFYSKNPNHIYFWSDDDRKEYKEEMINILKDFYGVGDK